MTRKTHVYRRQIPAPSFPRFSVLSRVVIVGVILPCVMLLVVAVGRL